MLRGFHISFVIGSKMCFFRLPQKKKLRLSTKKIAKKPPAQQVPLPKPRAD